MEVEIDSSSGADISRVGSETRGATSVSCWFERFSGHSSCFCSVVRGEEGVGSDASSSEGGRRGSDSEATFSSSWVD
jgi:hypothetical protein